MLYILMKKGEPVNVLGSYNDFVDYSLKSLDTDPDCDAVQSGFTFTSLEQAQGLALKVTAMTGIDHIAVENSDPHYARFEIIEYSRLNANLID